MAKPHQRAVALIIALVFLATSLIGGIAVIWQIMDDSNQESALDSSSLKNADLNEITAEEPKEGQLQGTKLADFTPADNVDELQVVDITEGGGEEAKEGATVTAHYTGALSKNGLIFESSLDSGQPATFSLSQVIPGWQQGVPGMKVGGKRRLIIPASLAYGEAGSPPAIGPNEPLVFDIELKAVENQ